MYFLPVPAGDYLVTFTQCTPLSVYFYPHYINLSQCTQVLGPKTEDKHNPKIKAHISFYQSVAAPFLLHILLSSTSNTTIIK